MELSQKLKELRKTQGLTQLELAERLFVSRQAISGWEAGTSRPSTENLQSLSRLFNIPLETLLDDTAEAEPAAAPEKLPAEEQAKEEGKGQGLGKDRRYKAIVMVIVLLAILLTTAVLAHRRTAQEKTGVMTFSEMECEDIDLAGAKSVPIGKNAGQIIERIADTPAEEKVWQHIHNCADIHGYRAEYATAIYKAHARAIEEIPYDRVNRGTGRRYQSEVYTCRKDEAGKKLDKAAMLICSKALGHNRISVVADNYIRGL